MTSRLFFSSSVWLSRVNITSIWHWFPPLCTHAAHTLCIIVNKMITPSFLKQDKTQWVMLFFEKICFLAPTKRTNGVNCLKSLVQFQPVHRAILQIQKIAWNGTLWSNAREKRWKGRRDPLRCKIFTVQGYYKLNYHKRCCCSFDLDNCTAFCVKTNRSVDYLLYIKGKMGPVKNNLR